MGDWGSSRTRALRADRRSKVSTKRTSTHTAAGLMISLLALQGCVQEPPKPEAPAPVAAAKAPAVQPASKQVAAAQPAPAAKPTPAAKTAPAPKPAPAVVEDDPSKPFVFADTSRFDSQLSDKLGATPAVFEIHSATNMSPNEIPPRLEKWFSAIVKSGGTVKMQRVKKPLEGQQTATRDFLLWEVFDLAFTIYEYVQEMNLYAPAKKYDAMVSYNGTEIQDITFTKRASAP